LRWEWQRAATQREKREVSLAGVPECENVYLCQRKEFSYIGAEERRRE
jgi:hypothetical protein